MQDPHFESIKSLPASDPLSNHISKLVGIDYSGYLQYRQDNKQIAFLVGKSINRNSNPVWGRPTADSRTTERPPLDRSSGLYSSRRSVVAKDTKDVHAPVKKNPTPIASKGTPKTGGTSAAEEVSLKDDLYLTSSDEEESTNDNPDCKDPKLPHHGDSRPVSDSSSNSKANGVKDLSYWMCRSTEKLKASNSNSDGAATPDDQKSQQSSTHEATTFNFKKDLDEDKESVTPKSSESGAVKYRELVKNGLDSLGGQRAAKRSNLGRMLSGLNDTDDEGSTVQAPSASEKKSKRSKHRSEERSDVRHNTPLSPVTNSMEWKQRKRKSPVPKPSERTVPSKCFVDRKTTKSPKRELIPYSDLGDDESDCSPIPSNIAKPSVTNSESDGGQPQRDIRKHPDRRISPSSSPVNVKRRKFDKTAPSLHENTSSKPANKSNSSPSHRHRSIKSESKAEPPKNEVFDKALHGFKHPDHLPDLHVSFKVSFPAVAPSHRKRKRRHNESIVKVEASTKESSKVDKVPISLCPVQSSSLHSNSDSESQHNRLAETGGFNPSTNNNSDPFDVGSPETDPMVDPTFDRNLSDVESDYEESSKRHRKKSKSPAPHSSHRHREGGGKPSAQAIECSSPSKGASSRVSTISVDQHSTDINSGSSARRVPSSCTFEHKSGHTSIDTNLVGQSLSVESSKKESNCKKSPESRAMARPPSPSRGDRTQSVPSKTSPVHDTVPDFKSIQSESVNDSTKSKTFNEPLYKCMPKIPRKRPPLSKPDEPSETKKKRKVHDQKSVSDESHLKEKEKEKEVTKVKEEKKEKDKERERDRDREGTKEKKSRDRHKIKKQKSSEPLEVKREPSSPVRAKFEVSVSDSCMPERSFSPNPSDNAAPFLPPATAAAFSEMATQCELMPAVERDVADPGTHTKRMAVAFRIAGGRGNTPIASAESRTQPQTPRSTGASGSLLTSSLSTDSQNGGNGGPRRGSTASVDEGEIAQNRNDSAADHQSNPQRCQHHDSHESLMDAVIRHRNLQEKLIQSENSAYQKMNSTQCFSEAAAKKHEADRLKNEDPSRFALNALRACYLFIQACYVEERQGKLDNAAMHYKETVHYVRSTSHMIEQVTKVPCNSDLLNTPKARMRHNFITLLCAEMKAILNYRIYFLAHRDTARLRPEVERELSRCGAGTGANGASERSTPESLSRSPAASCGPGSSGASLHLIGEGHHKLLRYLQNTKSLLAAQEYWQHALQLRSKHGSELKKIEERVFRRARHEFSGPETPVPCFLRYLNTFLTLHESEEL